MGKLARRTLTWRTCPFFPPTSKLIQYGTEVVSRSRRHILKPLRTLHVLASLQESMRHQRIKAINQHGWSYSQCLLDFIEFCSVLYQNLSQKEWSPPLAHYLKGLSYRAFHSTETFALHKRQFSLRSQLTKPTTPTKRPNSRNNSDHGLLFRE